MVSMLWLKRIGWALLGGNPTCHRCEKRLTVGSHFCPSCGFRLVSFRRVEKYLKAQKQMLALRENLTTSVPFNPWTDVAARERSLESVPANPVTMVLREDSVISGVEFRVPVRVGQDFSMPAAWTDISKPEDVIKQEFRDCP